jgi:hypothetical protein
MEKKLQLKESLIPRSNIKNTYIAQHLKRAYLLRKGWLL